MRLLQIVLAVALSLGAVNAWMTECPSMESYPHFKAGALSVSHPEEYLTRNGTSRLSHAVDRGGVGLYYSSAVEPGEHDVMVTTIMAAAEIPPTVAMAYFRSMEHVLPEAELAENLFEIKDLGKPASVISVSFLTLVEFLDINGDGVFNEDDEIIQERRLDQQAWGPLCTNDPNVKPLRTEGRSDETSPIQAYKRGHRHHRIESSLQIFNTSTFRAHGTRPSFVDFSIETHNANVLGSVTRSKQSRILSPTAVQASIQIRHFPFVRNDTLLALRTAVLSVEDPGSSDLRVEAPLPGSHPDEPIRRVKFRIPPPEPISTDLADNERPYIVWDRRTSTLLPTGKAHASTLAMSKLKTKSKAIIPSPVATMFLSDLTKSASFTSKQMFFVLSQSQPSIVDWGFTLGFGCPVSEKGTAEGTDKAGWRHHRRSNLILPLVLTMLLLAGCLTAYFIYTYRRKRFPVERRPVLESESR